MSGSGVDWLRVKRRRRRIFTMSLSASTDEACLRSPFVTVLPMPQHTFLDGRDCLVCIADDILSPCVCLSHRLPHGVKISDPPLFGQGA